MKNTADDKTKRSPGRPRRPEQGPAAHAASNRDKLLEAAARLFARQGIAASSLAAVAAEAGLTSAMVHYYFKSKNQLVEAVVAEKLGRFMNRVLSPYDGDDPLDFLLGLIPRLAEACRDHPWMPGLWIREVISPDGHLRPHLLKLLPIEVFARVSGDYRRLVLAGRYPADIEVRMLFFTVISNFLLPLAARDLLEKLPGAGPLSIDQLAGHTRALLSHGLGCLPEPASPRIKGGSPDER